MKNILLTGGGGYIGSHVLRLLSSNSDYKVTVVDNLSTGFKEPIDIISREAKNNIEFVNFDLKKWSAFKKLRNKTFDVVLHFAAYILVNESVEKPLKYFENNVGGSINLLKYMKESSSKKIVFSSTSAVYSNKAKLPFTEQSETRPENPYAESKLMMEKIIDWSKNAYNIQPIILRYFNPCGVSLDAKIGYPHLPSQHLMTNAVRGALKLQDFELTCGKVNTPDGTTIRDYFNILDLADVHNVAVEALLDNHQGGLYNVGIGKGHSVLEIIDIVKKVTGVKFELNKGKTRKGELPEVYCKPSKFMNEFNWKPKYSLEQAAQSLVKWFRKRPNGYKY